MSWGVAEHGFEAVGVAVLGDDGGPFDLGEAALFAIEGDVAFAAGLEVGGDARLVGEGGDELEQDGAVALALLLRVDGEDVDEEVGHRGVGVVHFVGLVAHGLEAIHDTGRAVGLGRGAALEDEVAELQGPRLPELLPRRRQDHRRRHDLVVALEEDVHLAVALPEGLEGHPLLEPREPPLPQRRRLRRQGRDRRRIRIDPVQHALRRDGRRPTKRPRRDVERRPKLRT
mmetsp:Transcript_24481/g.79079  ORF Transcript_24481/g.79079 Transcript_24481/m.79079 type:complete len:229 (-) Transcript_24481:192-878(-)